MKTVLITGGCGFLGSHLTSAIHEQDPNYVIKLLDCQAHKPVIKVPIETLLQRDITDPKSMQQDFEGVDCVIHTAGYVEFSIKRSGSSVSSEC